MEGFGSIHELAAIEVRVRRDLQAALHDVHCAYQLVIDEQLLNQKQHDQVAEMLSRAMDAIKRVSGA
jgi:hypothetical protein